MDDARPADSEDMGLSSQLQHRPSPRRVVRRPARALTVVLVAIAALASGTLPASAGSWPTTVTGVRQYGATATSLTVTANTSTYATGYRIYASTTRSSVYVANISMARRSATYSTPKVTLAGLTYTAAPYFYRFAAVNASGIRYSGIYTGYLRPATPTSAAVRSSSTGTSVTWASGSARGFRVARASNSAMTTGRVIYTISSQSRQFTPYGLTPGTRYYFTVRALNGAIGSAYTLPVSIVAAPREQTARVLTYNILRAATAGQYAGDGTIASWSERRAGVAKLINAAVPDIVAVQEGSDWAGSIEGRGGTRQVDDLTRALGGAFALARTEIPPTEAGYFRTGRYLLYRSSAYRAYGAGGYWTIGDKRYAAYQVLQHRTSGAKLLAVSVHLSNAPGTATGDAERKAETESLLKQASAYAASHRVPVVYAGDFNSHGGSNHAYDGPAIAMRAVRATDALQVAQSKTNSSYNSANQHLRTPPRTGFSVDHVYAPPGVALRTWRLGLSLTDGRFVGSIPSDHNPLSVDVTFPY
jgi:endonuclease/exonuclease/phosphatase family metal-dependent hydrolase